MFSFTNKMNSLSGRTIKSKAKPRHGAGGAQRKNWAFNPKNDRPSAVTIIRH